MTEVLSLWKDPLQSPGIDQRSMREIVRDIAEKNGYTLAEVRSREIAKSVVRVRQMAMYELYGTGRYSSTKIGQFFDRDHTTVLHAIKAVHQRLAAE